MSKREKFKNLAQAALAPISKDNPAALARESDWPGLYGTERLRAARLIPLDRIIPDPTQPRKHFPEKSLQELAVSIGAHGVLQPLTVSYQPTSNRFTIVTGERRYRAARRAGLQQVPCIILNELADHQRIYHQLVENLQREDITPFEEADAFGVLAEKFHLKHQQIAQIVGKSRTYVTKTIGLARVPEPVRRLCAQRGIASREHLTILAQQNTESAMVALLQKIAHQGGDIRTARRLARSRRSQQRKTRPFEFRYQTAGYTLRIRFRKRNASKQEIVNALTTTLNSLDNE